MPEESSGTRLKPEPPHGERRDWFSVGIRRVFGDGENPLEWSLPMGRVSGVTLRVHLVFPIYVISRMIWSISRNQVEISFVLPLMVSLFVLVLAHELGHCYACRRVGGRVEKVIMWPLGGLAELYPPPHWRASLMSAIGGPAVNLALWLILAPAVYVSTDNLRAVFFFPLEELNTILLDVETPMGRQPIWLLAIWSLHFANTLLIMFNLLLPMMPLDGGRIMHAMLWRKLGWKHAMEITTVVGIVCGGALGVFAVAGEETGLLIIAGLGIWVCYQEHRRLKFLDRGGEDHMVASVPVGSPKVAAADQAEKPAQDANGIDQAEIDRILAKISRVGMGGLSGPEKRTLKQATKRNRDTQ